jgi:hypothetical protein
MEPKDFTRFPKIVMFRFVTIVVRRLPSFFAQKTAEKCRKAQNYRQIPAKYGSTDIVPVRPV